MLASLLHVATVKPAVDLADVFADYFADYLKVAHCTAEQFAAVNAILKCRTAALGGHLRVCDACGRVQLVFNPCHNRNCPKCGAWERAQWLAAQGARLLPVPHFHVVFTVDHRVNPLAEVNPEAIYDLLFTTANQVLKSFARQYLGGEIGVTAVLHTWGQTLQHHIHLHCMVPAGALVQTKRGYRWRKSPQGFLVPVVALSQQFRDAFCQGLRRLQQRGELRLVGPCADLDVAGLALAMQARKWEVYIGKPPTRHDPERLLAYFGRYVHHTALSLPRLVAVEDGQVTFSYYDNRERDEAERGQPKLMTLPAVEFIRRFLTHVLPFQFKRVRHFGLYASAKRTALGVARGLLGRPPALPEPPKLDLGAWLATFVAGDPFLCPFCGVGRMRPGREFAPLRGFALWLLILLGLPVAGRPAEATP
jgi:hypothetical protein